MAGIVQVGGSSGRDYGDRTQASHPQLWPLAASHTQHILLWSSDLVSFLRRLIGKMGSEGRNRGFNHLGRGQDHTHIMFSRITFLDTYTDMCTHTDSLRHTLWILLEERKWLKRTQEAPQEWNLILPRLKRQDGRCYSTKQGSYWSLGPRSPSSLAGCVPAVGYFLLGLYLRCGPLSAALT